jgi:hypothetical protein
MKVLQFLYMLLLTARQDPATMRNKRVSKPSPGAQRVPPNNKEMAQNHKETPMTLYPPRTDSYPDPYPSATPNVTPGWTPPPPLGPELAPGMSAPPPTSQPRGRGLAVVALICSLLALALGFSPYLLTLRPLLSLACSVGALVFAIVGVICGHAAWSHTHASGWRALVVVALILGYLGLALGLFHILAFFARELALRRRRTI